MQAHWTPALDAWNHLLGHEYVLTQPESLASYRQNVSGWDARIPAVLRPGSAEEVMEAVRIAARHEVPIYPFSTGCNWGMGSKVPPVESVVMDLRRLNRIHEINVEDRYAVIEPGVTQGQLYDEITRRGLPLMLNVTGSGRETSLIGNALERGVGYFQSRAGCLTGMEVVLPDGQRLQTGMAQFPNSTISHLYPFGVGPSLDGLFYQSGLGIVTRAGFPLMGMPESRAVMMAKLDSDDQLPALIDRLAALQKDGVINTVVHVGNRERTSITLSPLIYRALEARNPSMPVSELLAETDRLIRQRGFGSWGAVTGLLGSRATVRHAMREIRAGLRGIAQVQFLTEPKVSRAKQILGVLSGIPRCRDEALFLQAVEPLFGMALGVPTDAALHSVAWPVEQRIYDPPHPDTTQSGLLYLLPMLPCRGREVDRVMQLITRRFTDDGFAPYVTFNLMEGRCIETVANLAYSRNDAAQEKKARTCIDELTAQFVEDGCIPYRVGIQSYPQLSEASVFWSTVDTIKHSLDPHHILAPGRYQPSWKPEADGS